MLHVERFAQLVGTLNGLFQQIGDEKVGGKAGSRDYILLSVSYLPPNHAIVLDLLKPSVQWVDIILKTQSSFLGLWFCFQN